MTDSVIRWTIAVRVGVVEPQPLCVWIDCKVNPLTQAKWMRLACRMKEILRSLRHRKPSGEG